MHVFLVSGPSEPGGGDKGVIVPTIYFGRYASLISISGIDHAHSLLLALDFWTFLRPFVCIEPKKTALRTDFYIKARTLIKSHLFGFQRYFQIYSNLVKLLILYKNSSFDLIKASIRKILRPAPRHLHYQRSHITLHSVAVNLGKDIFDVDSRLKVLISSSLYLGYISQ